ncbi:putative ribosomal protein S8 [Cardiosporidium cionae]|uniref:Ribosomal protein S8 n=1 Tax=Cardiosporidium cionae TaxID=476202 RepID=A0ABQ7J5Q4_9APIC|nr:putative ribosomal protein S8 [Cardiosporidium cionae]|eukprot:KAF8819341.1 putative ribosomal protein S8 [Cardiosporidium cionae]
MQRCSEMVQSLLRCTSSTQRCPFHVLNVQVLQLLQAEGYIRGFCVEGTKINILLKYFQGAPVIRNIRVISKPSRDIWVTPSELKFRTRFNTGLWIMQTTCGIMSHRDCIAMGIGGKMIFAVNNGYQHFC